MNDRLVICALAMITNVCHVSLTSAEPVPVQIRVTDDAGLQLPCRIHLRDSVGEPVRPQGVTAWDDHFVCAGQTSIVLEPGTYHVELERGPEYVPIVKDIEITEDGPNEIVAQLARLTNLRDAGWYSGDMHVHRPIDDVPLLMQAEDLDFAPTITWWNDRNPWTELPIPDDIERTVDGHRRYTIMAGEDEREGGALLYFGLVKPLDLTVQSREFPSPMRFVREAHEQNPNVWIDIEKPFWWDIPVWLASGEMDSIGLANNHMCRSQMLETEAWGRPRDVDRLPPPRGNGLWTQEIYYHILNSDIRIPPSAGSASGVLPNPVGYNRIYAHLDEPFTSEAWFKAVRAGQSFVTNGPLLVVKANQLLPGHSFEIADQFPLRIECSVELSSNDRVPQLEVISNGKVVKVVECANARHQKLSFSLSINEPGWFLVRAITDVENTFRFASTAPWYVEGTPGKIPVRKESAEFFRSWVEERMDRVKTNVSDADQLRSVLPPHEAALIFWTTKVQQAKDE